MTKIPIDTTVIYPVQKQKRSISLLVLIIEWKIIKKI